MSERADMYSGIMYLGCTCDAARDPHCPRHGIVAGIEGRRHGPKEREPKPAEMFPPKSLTGLPDNSKARKEAPIFSGFIQYFPAAMAEVARLSYAANEKHNPGQPLHWSRPKSDDHADCLLRHQVDAGTIDDDGFLHDVKVAWRAMAQLQLALEARGAPKAPAARG